MKLNSLNLAMATLACSAALLGACDKSRQSADGTTAQGSAGTAAVTGNGTVAATGSPEQGGANGTPSPKGVENGMSTSPGGATPGTVPPETAGNAR